ncbi:helix-turn-helix domain-containing protein [Psychrobacillus soli]|uniref:Helix-turn-helix domain-containing protein n=1 Tax=Psychrobacillus soli TaxID=1543965 RepID=A0A544TL05_9BACI|nr:helix-turn-helix domain-containing protein [Psychrobacillus soli]TQR18147.1 helix-turn-helix domain-containing protein [Psychrobacillus soli]
MEFPKGEIGKRIRYLRRLQGLTSEELAKLAGVSQSMISQIERGLVSPSLETLWKLAHSLKVQVFSFFETEEPSAVTISRAGEAKVVKRIRPNVSYELLSPSTGKQMSFFKMIVAPGEDLDVPFLFHGGEECGMMLSGCLRVELEGGVHTICKGDSIYFDSSLPHRFFNVGDEDAVAVWTMTSSF